MPRAPRYLTTCHPIPNHPSMQLWQKMVKWFFFVAPVIGVFGEAITGYMNGAWTYDNIQNNIQHMMMFGTFAFHMAVELWSPASPTQEGFNYLTLSFAFACEAYLFGNHLHGRSLLDG